MDDPNAGLREQTRSNALAVIRMYAVLPRTTEAQILDRQVLRSSTPVGAHHREAHRGRSDAEYISKIKTALQELDESAYWLELTIDAEIAPASRIAPLLDKTRQLHAILTTSVKHVKQRRSAKR